ncbi:hypothetical protein [Pseudoalteromonas luteoviolacea]|uniref:Uncharacterized protein n=1 Tax=Pseudoalteromonas luteoviolacea DSM 6061 TaxID=1365250 RepID=A0A166WKQ3_9GAMM|nr:hypothetical protein [Pseudoalteromonas luteoviolacea]KZN37594.1 hypothetical protein N475_01925 [Pseudoalteromonas luteoviolacea DSM 6061]KZN49620.1 hypothetical protein N474_05015 [Pseudoalteromonas luteoviolacea CPMOR-2]MBE0386990.1 hypothetical protein [Pseudoalteromonas luteoviolacea DSM 6061]TQF71835.1 hypothetical protein FLM44_12440 [Pseudoalteromonas luteoviolacea]
MLEHITNQVDELGGVRSQYDIDVDLRDFLKKTDWYVIRESETGVAMPEEIKAQREFARSQIQTPSLK